MFQRMYSTPQKVMEVNIIVFPDVEFEHYAKEIIGQKSGTLSRFCNFKTCIQVLAVLWITMPLVVWELLIV